MIGATPGRVVRGPGWRPLPELNGRSIDNLRVSRQTAILLAAQPYTG